MAMDFNVPVSGLLLVALFFLSPIATIIFLLLTISYWKKYKVKRELKYKLFAIVYTVLLAIFGIMFILVLIGKIMGY